MTIQESVEIIFQQLEDSLSGAAIVGHVRHVLEMFVCLQQGYETGMVNYEKRKRDKLLNRAANGYQVVSRLICSVIREKNNNYKINPSWIPA
ncbi:MAG: hypothetical protein JST09_09640 [Bacteroidetes bacterium]|nr:hypothetical protein [Bacteroidota bacterium]